MSLSPPDILVAEPRRPAAPAAPGGMTASSVTSAYRRMAPVYNWLFTACFSEGRRRAVELLEQAPGDRVLEVGVGTGLTLPLWHRATRLTGIDLSPEMLRRAEAVRHKHRLERVHLRVMDAQATDFADNQFDKIAALYVVSVVPDLAELIQEMRRVCKPGGRIVIVNHFSHPHRAVRWLESRLSDHAGALGFNSALPLDRITGAAGLRILRTCPVNWGGYWTLVEAENLK